MKKTLLLTILLQALGTVWAYDFSAVAPTGQMLYYNNNGDGTATLTYAGTIGSPYTTSHPGPEGMLEIPSEVEGKRVVAIGNLALQGCAGLTAVTVPTSVTTIGSYAFAYCTSLEELRLPSTITLLPHHMCYGCTALVAIDIPTSVTKIDDVAFGSCESLSEIHFPASVSHISDDAFTDCTGLAEVDFNEVKYVGFGAFANCETLTAITIPESMDTLHTAFLGCTGLRSVTLNAPNCAMGVENSSPFGINENITAVTIGESVESVSDYAFYGFKGLERLDIPDNVETIGDDAFSYAYGLKSLRIGRGVRSIGEYAFAGIDAVDTIVMRCQPPAIEQSTFSLVAKDKPLYVPCGQGSAYAAAEYWEAFTNIIEDCGDAAIEEREHPQMEVRTEGCLIVVTASQPTQMRVADMSGRVLYDGMVWSTARISVPAVGVYVMQTDNGVVRKVLVMQ